MHKAINISLLALLTVSTAMAQTYRSENTDFDKQGSEPEHSVKKSKSIFWRPAQKTPALQMAYAQMLEQKEHFRKAGNEYNALVHRWHNAAEAPSAQFAYARILLERGKYERAFDEFQYVVDFYPGLFKYNEVLDYQLKIANFMIGKRWGTLLLFPGFEAPERAIPLLEKIIANAPNWTQTPAIRLILGTIYENDKDYEGAVKAYEAVIQQHPGTREAEEAAFRKACGLEKLSDKSPRDERWCRDALSALASFMVAYPQSEKRSTAEQSMIALKIRLEEMYYQRARYYDEIEKRPTSALISYREFIKQFPASEHALRVMQRIETLEREQQPLEQP